jgi:hypothetical protein
MRHVDCDGYVLTDGDWVLFKDILHEVAINDKSQLHLRAQKASWKRHSSSRPRKRGLLIPIGPFNGENETTKTRGFLREHGKRRAP